jgi:lysophospholipase L1-like esterase
VKIPVLSRPFPFIVLFLLVGLGLPAPVVAAPESWAKEIAELTTRDASQPPPAGGVVFVGSSSIRLWKTLARDFPGVAAINRGFGGSELADSVFYADRIVLPYRPRTVVLFAGSNDLKNGKSPEAVLADFRAFRTKLHATLPEARLLFLSITLAPSRADIHDSMRRANALIAADIATDARCAFVDINTPMLGPDGRIPDSLFIEDRLHLNPKGYAIWTKVLAPYLR